MGLSQSKVASVAESEQRNISMIKTRRGRRGFFKRFTRNVSVGPAAATKSKLGETGEDNTLHTLPLRSPSSHQTDMQFAQPDADELLAATVYNSDQEESNADNDEEIFAEGCNYEIHKTSTTDETSYLDNDIGEDDLIDQDGQRMMITETSATIQQEIELELELPPTPSDMMITGTHIKPTLTDEQAEKAMRNIGEELADFKEALERFHDELESLAMSPVDSPTGDRPPRRNRNKRKRNSQNVVRPFEVKAAWE